MSRWHEWARHLRREVLTLYLVCRDPRIPWYARALAAAVAAYALSPIDLIPDFIPVLGYLDDLILIPVGVLIVRRLVPVSVLDECRARARAMTEKPVSRGGSALVVGIWLLLAGLAVWLLWPWPNVTSD